MHSLIESFAAKMNVYIYINPDQDQWWINHCVNAEWRAAWMWKGIIKEWTDDINGILVKMKAVVIDSACIRNDGGFLRVGESLVVETVVEDFPHFICYTDEAMGRDFMFYPIGE